MVFDVGNIYKFYAEKIHIFFQWQYQYGMHQGSSSLERITKFQLNMNLKTNVQLIWIRCKCIIQWHYSISYRQSVEISENLLKQKQNTTHIFYTQNSKFVQMHKIHFCKVIRKVFAIVIHATIATCNEKIQPHLYHWVILSTSA